MWTHRQYRRFAPRLFRRRAIAVLGLTFLVALVPELFRRGVGFVPEPNPSWIPVLVLAARDGTNGFLLGLISSAAGFAIGSEITGVGLASASSRLDSGPNLMAFAMCLLVSWIASWHLRRQADFQARIHSVTARAGEAETTARSLRDAAIMLRARVDRAATSLSFLREVAESLEGSDPAAAAQAAADLTLARTGVAAVAVKVGGDLNRLLAVRDARGPHVLTPLVLREADLAVPIRSGNDRIGAIVLWGIPASGLDEAAMHDLEVIASWCVPALTVAARRPADTVGHVRRAS